MEGFSSSSGGGGLEGNEGSPELFSDAVTELTQYDSNNSSLNFVGLGDDAPSPTKPPLDLHTLWKLLEKMDAERGEAVGSGEGEGGVGISPIQDDPGDSHQRGGGGKMSTWGKHSF